MSFAKCCFEFLNFGHIITNIRTLKMLFLQFYGVVYPFPFQIVKDNTCSMFIGSYDQEPTCLVAYNY